MNDEIKVAPGFRRDGKTSHNHNRRHILVNEVKRIVVRSILKSGCTTLDQWLRSAQFRPMEWDWPIPDGFHEATLIREPYPRYLSALHSMWLNDNIATPRSYRTYLERVEQWNQDHGEPWNLNDDPHFRPQFERVEQMRDPVLFRLERINDFAMWMRDHDVNVSDPPVENASDPGRRDRARRIVTRSIVEKFYAADLRLWTSL